jgi:hypothetical protein
MPPPRTLRESLQRERRTNRRLRLLLDEVRTQVRQNRRDLDLQFERIAQLQAELDLIKRSLAKD